MRHESDVNALQKEHDRLDGLIAQQLEYPGSDDLELARMKREKLRLKDEIAFLSSRQHAEAG